MKTSRGLSEVVMTVLLVFLTIVLVGVVAVGVVRFSQDRFGNFNLCSKIDVRIEERGYTCYDSVENILALQIVKNGEGVVSELNFILGFVDGNSESLIKKEEIAQNVERTFYFNLTNLSSAVKNVAVGAVSGGEDCGLGNFVNVPSCSLGDVDEDLVEEVVEVGGVWEVLDEGEEGVVEEEQTCIDNDGDGFFINESCGVLDCDDSNENVFPGAEEICNEVDDNCDGEILVCSAILNCSDLQNINNNLAEEYFLKNDVNCSESFGWNDGEGFEPIGSSSFPFAGSLYGGNYSISDLYINRPDENYVGLFSVLGGDIINLNLVDAQVTGGVSYFAGILSGTINGGKIENSFVSGNLFGGTGSRPRGVGGLAGLSTDTEISNTFVEANIFSEKARRVGGLVGASSSTLIENSFFIGNISGYGEVGGLVGQYNVESEINNSYVVANVVGSSVYVGGLVGVSNGGAGKIENSFFIGNVSGLSDVGRILGRFTGGEGLSDCYWNNISGGSCVGSGSLSGCFVIQNNESYFYSKINSPMSKWDFDNVWLEGESFPKLR